jgi:hypothetical protein
MAHGNLEANYVIIDLYTMPDATKVFFKVLKARASARTDIFFINWADSGLVADLDPNYNRPFNTLLCADFKSKLNKVCKVNG